MKQLLQDASSGELHIAEVPLPQLLPGCVLVRTATSLVSAGTERASAEFAGKSLFAKARARPDLVRDVRAKLQRDGLVPTLTAIRSRLAQPQSVGYSSAGTVIAVSDGVTDIGVGDHVACAGAGHAVHAEFACIPRLLLAKIPGDANVSFDEAAFSTIGAVCLHGIRTAEVSLGETVVVIGLGLLGQITVQLLKIAGCRVFGIDLLDQRVALALRNGAEAASSSSREFRDLCFQKTGGKGADAVLITAETPSSEPVNLAAQIARDRATIVAVGTVGMELDRKLYFEKELTFRVSRSYGPGRYDAAYEQKGRDYPIGHVRWTETRNMEAFLRFLADRKLDLRPLITHRFPIDQAARAYDVILGRTREPSLGVLLTYPPPYKADKPNRDSYPCEVAPPLSLAAPGAAGWESPPQVSVRDSSPHAIGLGVLGAGSFAQSILLPALTKISNVTLVGICSATGPRSQSAAKKFGFSYCSTSEDEIIRDPGIHAVIIATPHHLHAQQALAAIDADKPVFCEKPLCLNENELAALVRAMWNQTATPLARAPFLMVGFNRRFAPMAVQLKTFLSQIHEPISMTYRVNAGYLAADHWIQDPERGGGRILGEACHFVDFLCFLAGSPPTEIQAQSLGNSGPYSMDNIVATLRFANGSLGTVHYMANGDRAASKERLEVFGGASFAILEDFRRLTLVRHGRKKIVRSPWRQDKGHQAEMRAFVDALQGSHPAPMSWEEIVASTLATLRLQNACQTGQALAVDVRDFVASSLLTSPEAFGEPRNTTRAC